MSATTRTSGQWPSSAAARIGKHAIVHPHATILPGIHIGDAAVVGAGSVVVKDVPAGASVFGNPARVIYHKDS